METFKKVLTGVLTFFVILFAVAVARNGTVALFDAFTPATGTSSADKLSELDYSEFRSIYVDSCAEEAAGNDDPEFDFRAYCGCVVDDSTDYFTRQEFIGHDRDLTDGTTTLETTPLRPYIQGCLEKQNYTI